MNESNPKRHYPSRIPSPERDAEGVVGFVPRLPDPFEVQRNVAHEILGLQMAENLF